MDGGKPAPAAKPPRNFAPAGSRPPPSAVYEGSCPMHLSGLLPFCGKRHVIHTRQAGNVHNLYKHTIFDNLIGANN